MIKKIFCFALTFIFALQLAFVVYADDVIKIEAENYSDYYDTTSGNVMIGGVGDDDVETVSGATGVVISVDATEWLEYEVNVPQEGLYSLTLNGAVREQATMPLVKVSVPEKGSLECTLPTTGGRNVYDDIKIGNIILGAGENTVRILTEQKGFMLDYLIFEYVGESMRMLEDENCIEAESADEIPENSEEGSTGTVVIMPDGEALQYTLGSYGEDVYSFSALVKGSGKLSVIADEEVITQKNIDAEDYELVSFGNIMLLEGKNVLILKADGDLTLDYFNLIKFAPDAESEAEEIILEAENADRTEGNMSTGTTGSVKYVSFNQGRALEFDVNLTNSGLYQIVASSALDIKFYEKQTLEITIGETKTKATTYPTASFNDWELFPLFGIFLEAGEHTVRIEATYGGTHIDKFILKYLGDTIEHRGLTVSEKPVVTNCNIPKGADEIVAYYNMELDEESVVDGVTVKCDNKEIPVKCVVEGAAARMQLLKALTDGAKVEISLEGFTDVTQSLVAENVNYTLYTGAEDEGYSEFEDVNASISYENIEVAGTVLSGTGNTIEGRFIEMYIKSPDGTTSPSAVCETTSSSDGSFGLEYTLPQSSDVGVYELILYCEYAEEPCVLTVNYLNKDLEKVLLDSIKDSETAEEIKAIFDEYENTLGLDLENDLASLADKDAFFAHFTGLVIADKDELFEYYDKYLLLEKINQTNDESLIDYFITDVGSCEKLGLSIDRINLLGSNHSVAVNEIFELDEIDDLDAFKDIATKIIEKNIANELGVKQANIVVDDIKVDEGEAVSLSLITDVGFKEIKEAMFIIESSDISLDEAEVKVLCDGKVTFVKSENKLTVTVTPEWSLEKISEFAKILFVVPEEKGDYEMTISGVLTMSKSYASNEGEKTTTDINVYLDEKDVAVEVKAKRNQGSSGSGGSSPGKSYESSGSGVGGNSQNNNPVTPPAQDKENENEEQYNFKDVAANHWAYESVNALAEKNIISKAEMFGPDRNITREEFAKMLVNVLGIYDANAKSDFKDVDENSWYASYIASAKKHNIINGIDEENFGVGKEITRQDMAVMIYRALNLQSTDVEVNFADHEEIADYAKDAIYVMQKEGIINGVGDNMFAPKTPATRAMAAKIIFGMLEMTEVAK